MPERMASASLCCFLHPAKSARSPRAVKKHALRFMRVSSSLPISHSKHNDNVEDREKSKRAWFVTREQAEAFASDPLNTVYHADLAHLCSKCGLYHLSKLEWLEPSFSTQDVNFLSGCGIKDNLRCADCRREFQENVEFLTLRDGTMVHEECMP